MDIRDWLAIIVIIFIVLILLDGFRRKWLERRNRIVMKLDKNIPPPSSDDDEIWTKSELPNGGARTKPRKGGRSSLPTDLEEDVPVLMESVDLDEEDIEEYPLADDDMDALAEEDFMDDDMEDLMAGDDDELSAFDDENEEGGDDPWSAGDKAGADEEAGRFGDADQEENEEEHWEKKAPPHPVKGRAAPTPPRGRGRREDRIEPTFGDEELTFGRDDQGELNLEHHDLIDHSAGEEEEEDVEQGQAGEVIIINVMARPGTMIAGRALLPVLLKQGMRLGDMSIFHRHADSSGRGPVMFSMANMLKPGTFSMNDMEEFTTAGVCFFMQLPNKLGNMQCFEQMLKTAKAVREALDAVLKDENRSVFTPQTVEHSRQRIRDFELEMLARK